MFIRTIKQVNGKVSILIVESIRESSGKVRQKNLRHVATVFPSEVERFKEVAEYIKAEMEVERLPNLFSAEALVDMLNSSRKLSLDDDTPLAVNLRTMREEYRIVTGIHDIYGSLYDELGFSRIFKSCPVSKNVLKDIVMARLSKPCSKRSSSELLERDFGISISLEQIYRMMDTLTADRINNIQSLCWQHTKELFTEVKVMFYDCTTLYFESFTEDDLRSFGYSKDNKFNQGQILLALMVTDNGLPVGYDVFPGNMYEGYTLKFAIERIKIRYRVKSVIIVADSGLLSKDNIDFLEKENLQYIIGARLKSLSKTWQDKILDNTEYDKKVKEDEILRTAERIHAHIAICFIAFTLIRFLQLKIKKKTNENFSTERIRAELNRVQESIIIDTTNNNRYVIPSKPSQEAIKIYEVMNLKRNVVPFRLTSGM